MVQKLRVLLDMFKVLLGPKQFGAEILHTPKKVPKNWVFWKNDHFLI